jgi:hypothetical protein
VRRTCRFADGVGVCVGEICGAGRGIGEEELMKEEEGDP